VDGISNVEVLKLVKKEREKTPSAYNSERENGFCSACFLFDGESVLQTVEGKLECEIVR